ncbi:MAG: AEC family transporter [Hyphomicrobiaceae bacterium]
MASVLSTVLPVFGLILLGFLAARLRLLAPEAGKGLGDFIFTIAMPALLFRTQVTAAPVSVAPFALLASFFLAMALTWAATTLATSRLIARPMADAAPLSMATSFGNTVMLGLPLGLAHWGEEAASPLALVIALHAPVLWLIATLQAEWSIREKGAALAPRLRELARDLALNPVILGVVLGSFWRATGLGIAAIPDRMISMLGGAAVPGALFALGMSLVRFEVRGQLRAVALVTLLKLVLMPALAYLLAFHVFALPPVSAGVVVLLAACPTGANAFLFAARYERAVAVVSGAVALGTALAAITISALFLALG